MITLTRRSTPRKLSTTRVPSYSRQSLPRPARFYTTASPRVAAPALATAPAPLPEFPPFMDMKGRAMKPTQTTQSREGVSSIRDFLMNAPSYTILPTPLPEKEHSPLDDLYFPDSPMQDTISVIDACLRSGVDLPRARAVFEQVRRDERMASKLTNGLYNAMLGTYVSMALKDPETDLEKDGRRDTWAEDATALYDVMESGMERVLPDANTYANMLLLWLCVKQNPDGFAPMTVVPEPADLLRRIIDRQIPITLVVADRAFTDSADAEAAIKALSRAAVSLHMSKVVTELGAVELMGSQSELENVPEVMPVTVPKKMPLEAKFAEDGSVSEFKVTEDTKVEHEVPFNLATLRKHLGEVIIARRVLSEDSLARQKLLEESVYDQAVERLRHEAQKLEELGLANKGLGHADLKAWMWTWHQKLQTRIAAEVEGLIKQEEKMSQRSKDQRLAPYLSLVKPEKLSLIAILELMHLHGSGGISEGMKTARALLAVGKAVEIEYKAQMCRKNNISVPTSTTRHDSGYFSNLGYRDLYARRVAARKYMEDAEDWTAEWSQVIRVRIGSFLVDALMDVATVTRHATDKNTGEKLSEDQPAFYHSYEYVRGHKLGIIKLNPIVSDRIAKESLKETLHPRHLPMLVQPKRWISFDEGGYIYNKSPVMRYKDSQEQLAYLREASKRGDLELIYAGLDVLGSTPWQVNRKIFDVVLEVWNSGKRLGKIPPIQVEESEPEKPPNYDSDPKARAVYVSRHRAYLGAKANNHSDRCSTNYKIEIARTFLEDTFYLPHNVDFRGRAYPIPPHLNHLGDDLSRGLMKFAEARPLGERGLRWLKIHLANLYGYDKGTFDERVNFVHEHLEDIYDSADRPLEGRGWWRNADDPWQCLATCMELKAALESPDPHAFESSLPVHQDGTCNGLQHYAALGGDARGAQQVNLDVTDKPSDVYTFVADMVERQLAEEVAKGPEADQWAVLLQGKIARKVVKQTVMTTVYGVTFVGAREQIEKRLVERGDVPIEEAWHASAYLAKRVLACIGDLFSGARGIQTWLNASARLITKAIPLERLEVAASVPPSEKAKKLKKEQMTSVIWTTPLGLPVVQPYRTTKRKQIHTALQTVFISDPNSPASVNSMKQSTAFPPNFIHSLDATHMMLSALECKTRDITFASVHDSYWTHASDVDEMSVVIRDTFIQLHSSDILGKLADEFRVRYKDYKIPLSLLTKDQQAKLNTANANAQAATGAPRYQISSSGPEQQPEEEQKEQDAEDGEERADAPDMSKFVDLIDLLPPLPEKGEFDVNTIKKSLYFFS